MTFLSLSFSGITRADDCWISVAGSGSKNGLDKLNAYSAAEGERNHHAQTCWEQTSADGTMHVMEGNYTAENRAFWQLKITQAHDGSKTPEGSFKKLRGEGRVMIQGARTVPYVPSMKTEGGTWIQIAQGAGRILIENFHVSRVEEAIAAKEGGNTKLNFQDLHFEDTRQNFVFYGHPQCYSLSSCPVKPEKRSREIRIKNTSGIRYSKRHIRLSKGVSHVLVENSHADAAFLDGDFAVGFDVENPSHDIEFIHCSARANIYSLSSYWNGDGFKSESETKNIRWTDCSAFDNGDAGFDIKSDNGRMENIIALRNNRNIRIWSPKTTTITNANASYSKHWGGEGSEAGIWSTGAVDLNFCTLHNNKIQVAAENNGKGARIRLYDSILSMSVDRQGTWISQEQGSDVRLIRTAQWNAGLAGEDPQYRLGAMSAAWEGGNHDFNSILYGKQKGYYYE